MSRLNIDKDAIRRRHEQLEAAAAELKSAFVGIDAVIDQLIDAIRVWFLMPEVLARPVIVNLWGMTGVGKTDLVRRLVRALECQDRFCEVELSNGDTTSWLSSVAGVLDASNLNDERPKIVLFDEIQRFNTLDSDGKPLPATKFTDFWELLSDGRLAKRTRDDLDHTLEELIFSSRDARRRKERGEDVDPDAGVGFWEAQSLKRILALPEDVSVIAEMNRDLLIERVRAVKAAKRVYEPVDHSRTLIIVSGNLDDAFSMAQLTGEADVDADIFHAFTQKITVVDVKLALARRFKPEQVARFGNIHLIYTSLRRADFEELIRRELARVRARATDRFGVRVDIDAQVERLIYRNGVFPTQGVRPVFSSVVDIVESTMSRLLFQALMAGSRRVRIEYDEDRRMLVTTVGSERAELPYLGRLDSVRQRNTADVVANVSVHEAGHAVAYVVLFGLAPLQLTSRIASSHAAGFTFPHEIHETRGNLGDKIKTFLAGGIAEEIVFGEANASSGRGLDRIAATELTVDYVRRYGFDAEFQAVYTLEMGYALDKTATDPDIEKMIARLAAQTHELLIEHRGFLVTLARRLLAAGRVDADDVVLVAAQHGLAAQVRPEGYLHLPAYADALESRPVQGARATGDHPS
jgi:hypothetical protein